MWQLSRIVLLTPYCSMMSLNDWTIRCALIPYPAIWRRFIVKKSSRPKRRELIQRQQQPVVLRSAGAVPVQMFHQRPAGLIDHQPDQRAQSRGVRWRRLEVERHGPVRADQIAEPKIAGRGVAGDDVVRPKRRDSRRRAAHAGLELLRLAAQFVWPPSATSG